MNEELKVYVILANNEHHFKTIESLLLANKYKYHWCTNISSENTSEYWRKVIVINYAERGDIQITNQMDLIENDDFEFIKLKELKKC